MSRVQVVRQQPTIVESHGEVCKDRPDFSNRLLFVDLPLHLQAQRLELGPKTCFSAKLHILGGLLTLHQEQVLLLGNLAEVLPLRSIQSRWLLNQHMLTSKQSRLGVSVMSRIDGSDINDLDSLRGQLNTTYR